MLPSIFSLNRYEIGCCRIFVNRHFFIEETSKRRWLSFIEGINRKMYKQKTCWLRAILAITFKMLRIRWYLCISVLDKNDFCGVGYSQLNRCVYENVINTDFVDYQIRHRKIYNECHFINQSLNFIAPLR